MLLILGCDDGGESAAHGEIARDSHSSRFTDLYEIIQNSVCDRFIKNALVSKGVKVKFQRLKFEAALVGHVINGNGSEIRHASHRANRGELRARMHDPKIS